MKFKDILELVWTNLGRRKGRTFLTTTGVVIGTAAIITMLALGMGLQQNMVSQLQAMVSARDITVLPPFNLGGSSAFVTDFSKTKILDDKLVKQLEKLDNVESVSPSLSFSGSSQIKIGRYASGISITGFKSRPTQKARENMDQGRFYTKDSGLTLVLGYKVPETFSDTRHRRSNERRNGDDPYGNTLLPGSGERIDVLNKTALLTVSHLTEDGKMENKNLRVKIVGVAKETGSNSDYTVYMPIQEVEKLNGWATGRQNSLRQNGYDSLTVTVDNTNNVDLIVGEIMEMGYTPLSMKQITGSINQIFIILQAILGGIGAIALLIASIGIINTMTMAIYERTREIGIMKVVGASLKDIRNIFIIEAATIGFLGGVFGLLLSYIITLAIDFFLGLYIVGSGGTATDGSLFVMPLWLMLFAMFFSTLVGLAAGLYPAMKAARLSALNAIRTE